MPALKLALLRPVSIRRRLWQGGLVLLAVLITFFAGNFLISPDRAVGLPMLGHDYLAFYSAGTLARQGHLDRLYDLEAIRALEHATARANGLETGSSFGPFWNPPFYALALAPLASLRYPQALLTWTNLNISCLLIALGLLVGMLPQIIARAPRRSTLAEQPVPLKFSRDWRNALLVPLLILVSMPFLQAISHGQNTFASLLLVTLVVAAWRSRRPVAAGLVCGLLFYKPQLGAVLAAVLVLSLGLRVCVGLGVTLAMLMLATAIAAPDALGNYLYRLPLIVEWMQVDHPYLWERHVTLKAFWRLILQGRSAGAPWLITTILTIATAVTAGIALLAAAIRSRKPGLDDPWTGETRALARDRLIAATICFMPLLMPFYLDYDLLLLAVPATLFAAELIVRPPGSLLDRTQRWLIGCWIALYLWLYINPPLARITHVNLSVVLLASVAGLSAYRAMRRGLRTSSLFLPVVHRVSVKRAA